MIRVALAGNPNCGKTSLFNRLTGMRQKVSNYPGVTVERRTGQTKVGAFEVEMVDLPGTYSLVARSRDESIAFEVLSGFGSEAPPDAVVIVVDASNLLRNLYLALSVLELGRPSVLALNMMDVARKRDIFIDTEALSKCLGIPVVPIVAKTGEGIPSLRSALEQVLETREAPEGRPWKLEADAETLIAEVQAALPQPQREEGVAVWVVASTAASAAETKDPLEALPPSLSGAAKVAVEKIDPFGPQLAEKIIEARYQAAREIVAVARPRAGMFRQTLTDQIDAVLLHPVWGIVAFFATMALLFQSIFAWADPLMSLIEDGVGLLQIGLRSFLPEGTLVDLLADGVVGGVGNVIVFVPQIAFLFGFIAVLEDTGYLSRVAFIADRVMARVGLHGRAFVPLLSGFACAVPAILATRAIESPKDRLVTILITPLVSCSARLPVYTLLIATLFSGEGTVLYVFSVGGFLMLAMYSLSFLVTVAAAFVLKRTVLRSPTPPLVLELPAYRMPEAMSVLARVYDRCRVFVRDAGTTILACSMVLWALLYFPSQVPESFDLEQKEASVVRLYEGQEERKKEALQVLAQEAEAARIRSSIAGTVGQALTPVFEPLGYDWKMVVAILASFAAREVFVSTLGLVYGIGDDADEESIPLREKLRLEKDPETGKRVYTPLVGLSLMVFFVIALQCMSTLAAIRRETGTWRWPLFAFAYAGVLAWAAALFVYQGGRLLGFE